MKATWGRIILLLLMPFLWQSASAFDVNYTFTMTVTNVGPTPLNYWPPLFTPTPPNPFHVGDKITFTLSYDMDIIPVGDGWYFQQYLGVMTNSIMNWTIQDGSYQAVTPQQFLIIEHDDVDSISAAGNFNEPSDAIWNNNGCSNPGLFIITLVDTTGKALHGTNVLPTQIDKQHWNSGSFYFQTATYFYGYGPQWSYSASGTFEPSDHATVH